MNFQIVSHAEAILVCYYGSWAAYRPGDGKFLATDIDPHLCTHLVYSFIGLNRDTYEVRVSYRFINP